MKAAEYTAEISHQDRSVIVHVSGRIDSTNYRNFLAECQSVGTDQVLVLDMDGLDHISSAGIRVLISLAKKHGDGFFVVNAGPFVMNVLESTGITSVIPVKAAARLTGEESVCAAGGEPGFRALLKAGGDRTMVLWNGEAYTYADIDRISQIIAADLYELGVRKYSHVAICALDSLNLICTFLAIQKLGAVAVLMNPACTRKEIIKLVDEGGVTHICCESILLCVTFPDLKTYRIGNGIDFRKRLSEYTSVAGRFAEAPDPDDPGVIVFTSGSTGTPKAALHSFYSLRCGAARLIEANHLTGSDRLCHTLPFFHIGGLTLDLMSTLMTGAALCFPEYEPGGSASESMECILNTIEKYGCTVMNAIPTTLFSICGLACFSQDKIRTLRTGVMGAMPVTRQQMKLLRDNYGHVEQIVMYGMTELLPATIVSSEDTWEHLASTVGRPADGVEVEIRTPDGRLCPVGETGEICLRAEQTMTCYYKADMERQPLDCDGFIRSGDLGFMDGEGYLHLAGRIKDIIIRGGENIVPGEIEAAIASIDEVLFVYVCGVPDDLMGEKVAAAVVMKDDCLPAAEEIKKRLPGKLARHKIPSYLMVLDSFPLLPNGKNDKAALKKMLMDYSLHGKIQAGGSGDLS